MAADMGVPFLGRVPIDPMLARSCDEGKNFVLECPTSPAVSALKSIVSTLRSKLRDADTQAT